MPRRDLHHAQVFYPAGEEAAARRSGAAVSAILDELGSHSPSTERAALRRLVGLGRGSLGALAGASITHRNAFARALAVAALARLDGKSSHRSIRRALRDRTMVVRLHALVALHRHAWGPAAPRAVTRLLRDPSGGVRGNAVRILGLHRERSAARAIARSLRDEKWYVRQQAAAALGQVGSRAAAAPLRRALDDARPAVRVAAARSLRQLGESTR